MRLAWGFERMTRKTEGSPSRQADRNSPNSFSLPQIFCLRKNVSKFWQVCEVTTFSFFEFRRIFGAGSKVWLKNRTYTVLIYFPTKNYLFFSPSNIVIYRTNSGETVITGENYSYFFPYKIESSFSLIAFLSPLFTPCIIRFSPKKRGKISQIEKFYPNLLKKNQTTQTFNLLYKL